MTQRRSIDRPLAIGAAIVVILVAVAAILALRGPRITEFEPGTPEATVQRFVQALIDDDEDEAFALLIDEESCDPEFDRWIFEGDTVRVGLESTEIEGDRADVTVTVTQGNADPLFDPYEWTNTWTFDLERIDGGWLIDPARSPFIFCKEKP